MKPFGEYITEESQIVALRKEAEAVRRKTIAKLEKKLREAKMNPDTKRFWKSQVEFYKNLNFDGFRSKYQLNTLVAKIALAPKHMGAEIKDDEFQKKSDELIKKMKAMRPITLCDIMKSPDSETFIELLVGGGPSEVALQMLKKEQGIDILYIDDTEGIPWIRSLQSKTDKLANWFSQEGGPKQDSIGVIRECMACKGRAAWTKWGGKAYRGVGRSIQRIKRYEYTGDIVKMKGSTWLVAKVNYKGRYGAQSWTPDLNVAAGFRLGGGIQVVLEVELKENETFLRPEVIEQVSEYKNEREVIRVSDRMVPATAYVKLFDILDADKASVDKVDSAYIKRWTEGLFGAKAARKLLANKAFVKEVS